MRAISSVLNGTTLPHEILVYDDKSSDETVNMIKQTFSANKLVKLTVAKENRGAGYARNELLKHANGNFIAFLDADDWWADNKLELQVQKIRQGNYDIVTGGYNIFTECGTLLGNRIPIKNITFYNMHFTNWLPMSMTIFRKDLQSTSEMPKIRKRQDYAFWLKVFRDNANIKCYTIDQIIGGYTRRPGSLSSGKLSNIKANYVMFRKEINYSRFFSLILVFVNSLIRLSRP